MKTLIITAHPSKSGFTHRIAQKYAENSDAEILNLYESDLTQDFLRFENPHEIAIDEKGKKIQEKISLADEIVFIFPIWWGDAPAILKNFFDHNFSAGFAFKYEKGKAIGLLKGKTARIFATCDFPFPIFYKIFLGPIWKIGRLKFCGLEVKNFTILGNKRKRTEEELEKFLEKVADFSRGK